MNTPFKYLTGRLTADTQHAASEFLHRQAARHLSGPDLLAKGAELLHRGDFLFTFMSPPGNGRSEEGKAKKKRKLVSVHNYHVMKACEGVEV
jgi:hypothetical protein